jgi:hypothetical protein
MGFGDGRSQEREEVKESLDVSPGLASQGPLLARPFFGKQQPGHFHLRIFSARHSGVEHCSLAMARGPIHISARQSAPHARNS